MQNSNPFNECPSDMAALVNNMANMLSMVTECVTSQQRINSQLQDGIDKILAALGTATPAASVTPKALTLPTTRDCVNETDAYNKFMKLRTWATRALGISTEEFDRRVGLHVGHVLRLSIRGTHQNVFRMLSNHYESRSYYKPINEYMMLTDLGLMRQVYNAVYDVIKETNDLRGIRKPIGAKPASINPDEHPRLFIPHKDKVTANVPVGNVRNKVNVDAKLSPVGKELASWKEARRSPAGVAFDKLSDLAKTKQAQEEDNVIPG